LEAAGPNAIMTSRFIEFLENLAYFEAKKLVCIDDRPSKKIAMPELFDMIAGSDTGAIIGATISIENTDKTSTQMNKYFADKAT
jgi:hypothetical protein